MKQLYDSPWSLCPSTNFGHNPIARENINLTYHQIDALPFPKNKKLLFGDAERGTLQTTRDCVCQVLQIKKSCFFRPAMPSGDSGERQLARIDARLAGSTERRTGTRGMMYSARLRRAMGPILAGPNTKSSKTGSCIFILRPRPPASPVRRGNESQASGALPSDAPGARPC